MPGGKLMDVREVAEFLKLAPGTIYHLVSEGRLPCVRLSSRCLRFQEEAIRRYIDGLASEPVRGKTKL
jgi:excisionase family DNA binding protein